MSVDERPEVIERVAGIHGELALRRAGNDFEIISNGCFLMDTRNGVSERMLATAAIDENTPRCRMLIGGLGVGYTLAEAAASAAVHEVTVVECEPAIISWYHQYLADTIDAPAVGDQISIVCADLIDWLDSNHERFDAICIDIDNGPNWMVGPANTRLYSHPKLAALADTLSDSGTLTIWSASRSPDFEQQLHQVFRHVDVIEVPVTRGEPDIVYCCTNRP